MIALALIALACSQFITLKFITIVANNFYASCATLKFPEYTGVIWERN